MKKQKKLRLALACVKDESADFGLYLKQNGDNIRLMAVIKGGGEYTILSFLNDGRLFRYSGINDGKIQTDAKGRIKFKRDG